MIKDGLAKRGEVHFVNKAGHTLFKGENITASRISGTPVYEKFDVSKTSSPSIWAYPEILPETMYAIPVLEQLPVAAPLKPSEVAMENTVIVFGPRADLAKLPFDVLLLSNVYGFFHVVEIAAPIKTRSRTHLCECDRRFALERQVGGSGEGAHGIPLRPAESL